MLCRGLSMVERNVALDLKKAQQRYNGTFVGVKLYIYIYSVESINQSVFFASFGQSSVSVSLILSRLLGRLLVDKGKRGNSGCGASIKGQQRATQSPPVS